ncbi:MAG: MBL fold metallo-hydrolase [Salinivirgaceae bacterium]
MKISVLRIEKFLDGKQEVIFPVVIQNKNRVFLVDCGYEETIDVFESELNTLGIKINNISGVIITHDDHDHLGGLKGIKTKHPEVKVYTGVIEQNAVSGKVKSERLVQAEMSFDSVPDEYKAWASEFIQKLKNRQRFNVDFALHDGDIIENQIRVVHTPGHTKGHISLFYEKERIVVAGDALIIENGTFNLANPQFTLDIKQAIKSIEKIKALKPNRIICYHGGIMDKALDLHLARLINKYS